MTGARDITQLCFSSNLAGTVANKIEQSFYSVYSYSGIESIEHTLKVLVNSEVPSSIACFRGLVELLQYVIYYQFDTMQIWKKSGHLFATLCTLFGE